MKTTALKSRFGFTLVELMVVVSVIGILSAVVYASFGDSRKIARDDIRKTDLKNLQVAIELYRAQNGRYPEQGCGTVGTQWAGAAPVNNSALSSCPQYIVKLVPDFIASLPIDPFYKTTNNLGYYYRTDALGTAYKLMARDSVEVKKVTSYADEFARCPSKRSDVVTNDCGPNPNPNTYAVYKGAAALNW